MGRAADGAGGPVIGASLGDLTSRDLVPFEAVVDAGVPVVEVGDAVFPAIDPDAPASQSPAVLAVLRDSLGFGGVALGDAGAGGGPAVVAALAAGIDLLLIDDGAEAGQIVREIAAAVEDGRLPRERLAEAAARVERLASSLARIPCVTDG
jgi:beta-N-acetylhexosaminidase